VDLPKIVKSIADLIGGPTPSLEELVGKEAMRMVQGENKGTGAAPDVSGMVRPLIQKNATEEQVTKLAEKIESAMNDYEAIVSFAEGRRVNLVDTSKSLVLAKPLGMLDHGGDVVLDEHSMGVAVLRRWLDQGAPRGVKRQLVELRVDPAAAIVATPGMPITMRAIAKFSDGAELNVTESTIFRSEDSSSIEILSEPPRAICHRPGRHIIIMARFWNRIVPVSITLPYESKLNLNAKLGTPTSINMVDVEIDSQLEILNLSASTSADELRFFGV